LLLVLVDVPADIRIVSPIIGLGARRGGELSAALGMAFGVDGAGVVAVEAIAERVLEVVQLKMLRAPRVVGPVQEWAVMLAVLLAHVPTHTPLPSPVTNIGKGRGGA
jgi:hypothetical protein